MLRGFLLAAALAALAVLAATPRQEGRPADRNTRAAVRPSGADRWSLFQGLTRSEEVEVVCANEELLPAVERALARTRATVPHALRLVAPGPPGARGGAPRIAIGLLDEPWLADLARAAGVTDPDARVLRVEALGFQRQDDVLVATVADPERPGLPLTLYVGFDARAVAAELDHVTPHWRPGILMRRGGLPQLRVPLRSDGLPDWGNQVDYGALRRAAGGERAPDPVIRPGAGLVVRFGRDVDRGRGEHYAELLAGVAEEVRAALGADLDDVERVEVQLAGSVEDLFGLHGVTTLSHAAATEPIGATALLAAGMPHDGGECAARAVALQAWGPPRAAWMLDGVGGAFARTWWGSPRPGWVAFLVSAGLAPSAAELVAPDAPSRISPHVLVPLRGALFAHLLETDGAEEVARLWAGTPLVCDGALEDAFRARLGEALRGADAALAAERERRRAAALGRDWRGGVHVTPARGDVDASMGAIPVFASLGAAAAAGATSAAFPVLAYLEPRGLEFAGDALAPWPDGEPGDLALARGIFAARAVGLDTLLAPELILTPTGTWGDARALGGDADVDAAFEQAERAFVHYALLGELCGVEVLCLGAESAVLSNTLPRPGDHAGQLARKERFHAGWSDLIARVRAAFGGALTYAAGSSFEVGRVAFWSELDYVGVTLFASVMNPTSDNARAAGRQRIDKLLTAAGEIARASDRPLLVVQAGFPSHTTAHEHPLLASGMVDLAQQEELYRLLADAIGDARALGGLAGVFLWRWDPDPDAGGASDPSHTPQRKPAAREVRRIFAR